MNNSASGEQPDNRIDFNGFLLRVEGQDIKLDHNTAAIVYDFMRENVNDNKVLYF